MDSNKEVNDEEKYSRCWVCNSLILKKREENHHVIGEGYSEDKIKLCILCHDLVDRMPLDNINVFQEFLVNTLKELERLPLDFKWTKLYILKIAKIIPFNIENSFKDKQKQSINKGEEVVKV